MLNVYSEPVTKPYMANEEFKDKENGNAPNQPTP